MGNKRTKKKKYLALMLERLFIYMFQKIYEIAEMKKKNLEED
jgi:hypothetical protein